MESLRFCVNENKIKLYTFVIMNNHIHFVWQPLHLVTKAKLQHDFITFTARNIKEDLKLRNPALLEPFKVDSKNKVFQLWKRNALSVDLFTAKVL